MIEHRVKGKLLINFKKEDGSSLTAVILLVIFVVYVFLPMFAAVIEKQIFSVRASDIRDSMEISCIAAYNSLNTGDLSKIAVTFDDDRLHQVFTEYLVKNLRLNNDLTPKATGSVAQGQVQISSIQEYISGFPLTCPDGNVLNRPTIHVKIIVPIEPTLYKYTILDLLGVDKIYCNVHLDVELPVNQ